MCSVFWESVADQGMSIYLDRVSTDMNISDELSRDSFDIALRCGWEIVEVRIPEFMNNGPGKRSLN